MDINIKTWIKDAITKIADPNGSTISKHVLVRDGLDLLDNVKPRSVVVCIGNNSVFLTKYEWDAVQKLINDDKKICAIKELRTITRVGLKEAKEAIENPSNWDIPGKWLVRYCPHCHSKLTVSSEYKYYCPKCCQWYCESELNKKL